MSDARATGLPNLVFWDALVVHALSKQSGRTYVESFRILHDWDIQSALFKGEQEVGNFPIAGVPRLSAVHIFDRELPFFDQSDVREWFSGNVSPYVQQSDPSVDGSRTTPTGPPVTRSSAFLEFEKSLQSATQNQLESEFAPMAIVDGDPLWDRGQLRDWVTVRAIRRVGTAFRESLDLLPLEFTFPHRRDRDSEVSGALGFGDSFSLFEYQVCSPRLNNSVLFQIVRRVDLDCDAYQRTYIEPQL